MRGFAAWLMGKFSVLLFAAIIFVAFIYFYTQQLDFEQLDRLAKTNENVAQLVDAIGGSPYYVETLVNLSKIDEFAVDFNKDGLPYLAMNSSKKESRKTLHANVEAVRMVGPKSVNVSGSQALVKLVQVT